MSLSRLPPELLQKILYHLDILSLLSFSLTSATNHTHHLHALHALDLAVFPKKVHALIAFLQSSSSHHPSHSYCPHPHQIAITLPSLHPKLSYHRHRYRQHQPPPALHLPHIIAQQNTHLTTLLTRYPTLHSLTFHAWDLLPSTATHLSSYPSLHHLSLHFDHPSNRHPALPPAYFDGPPPPSTLWNPLAGLGDMHARTLRLRNLRTLCLERVGCTSAQLRGFVGANPNLGELRVRKVSGVDAEFMAWLGGEGNLARGRLKVLMVERCDGLVLRSVGEFAWLEGLRALKELRVEGCGEVDAGVLRGVCAGLGLMVGGVMGGSKDDKGVGHDGTMEVDEACL